MPRKKKLPMISKVSQKRLKRHRFVHYALSETVALSIDLILLWVLVSVFHLQYLFAAAIAYILAVTIHYQTIRKHVFHGSIRDPFHLYSYFIGVGVLGLMSTLAIMGAAVVFINTDYLFARVFAAVSIIPATYGLNKAVTFLMPQSLPTDKESYCNLSDTHGI